MMRVAFFRARFSRRHASSVSTSRSERPPTPPPASSRRGRRATLGAETRPPLANRPSTQPKTIHKQFKTCASGVSCRESFYAARRTIFCTLTSIWHITPQITFSYSAEYENVARKNGGEKHARQTTAGNFHSRSPTRRYAPTRGASSGADDRL